MATARPGGAGRAFPLWFAVGATAFFGFLLYQDPYHLVSDAENKWGDLMFRVRGTRPGFEKLQIVAIDDYSIDAVGPFPWKRGIQARLLRKLARLGVKTVAFDVLFLDPRPDDPAGDRELAQATRETGRAIHLVNFEKVAAGGRVFVNVQRPKLPGLAEASALLAHPNVHDVLDQDGILRRATLYDFSTDDPVPLLGAGIWMHYTGRPLDDLGKFPDPMLLNMRGRVELPTAAQATPIGGAFHFVHAASLFQRKATLGLKADLEDLEHDALTEAERAAFQGGIALIGATAVGAFDHYPSPFEEQTPGVVFHANVFDNLLRGDWLRRAPPWSAALLALALVWAAAALIRLPGVLGSNLVLGGLAALAAADYGLFLRGFRLDFVVPASAFALTYGGLLVHKVIVEGREKRWIQNTFGQYLSPKVVESLVKDPDKVKLGGDKRDMSIFFLDIAHFTNISEKLTPEQLTEFLNEYLSALTDVILKHDGVVDKFIGDCVMAFWNAPVDQPRHRELACLAAVECIETIQRLNQTFIKGDFPELPAIRIGLNAGDAVVGNMGSRSRFSYTVIGDEVNLASRLEGANKFFGSSVMASEAVYAGAARDLVEAREIGRVRVVGKAIPIRVFELLARKGALPPERRQALDLYGEGIGYYGERKFEPAAACFQKASELTPADKVTKIYLSASQDYSLIPPPEDWDGVFNLTSK